MSRSSGAEDDSDLDSPLISGEEDEGGVTLHGETINVDDLFLSGRTPGTDGSCSTSAEEQLTSLSMDNRSNNTAAQPPSVMAYAKQTLLFLPKKGRVLYYNARHQVARLMGERSIRDGGGLTPVSSSRSSPSSLRRSSSAITQRSALFKSTRVPLLFKLVLPLLIIANHVIFYQAQTLPMWNLTYKTNITISGTARTLKTKAAFDALNLPHEYSFESHEEKVVETFTYWDAIRKLWEGEGLGDAQTISKVAAVLLVVFSGIWPHLKLLLVHVCWFFPFLHGIKIDDSKGRCSCCRPDPKRCTLCCSNGHAHQSYNRRSPFLRILSTLGKWSLADVLVVCILIAVLHLDWEVNPSAIRAGVENELPVLLDYAKQKFPNAVQDCAQLLHYTCGKHAKVIHLPACLTCQGLVNNAYSHPEWTTGEGKDILEGIDLQGGGHAQLRVMGMIGTYYFCGAVIISILISLVVDLLDQQDRQVVEEELVDRKRELEFISSNERENGLELQDESNPTLNEAFLSDAGHSISRTKRKRTNRYACERARDGITYRLATDFESHIPTATTNCHLLKQAVLVVLALASLPLVCYSVTLPTMERLVYGGGPQLLHEVLGMKWEKEYSLKTLVETTGDAGGWDIFLMVTFGLFAIVGPILRSACLILHALLGVPVAVLGETIERPRQRTALRVVLFRLSLLLRKGLVIAIDSLGAFVCWEVLMVALVMIQLEMPSITDTIYEDNRCEEADPEHGTTCIEVQFNATDSFFVVGIAWAVLVLASGFTMDLASKACEDSSPVPGQEKDRYEYGGAIPRKRSNKSVVDALAAATGNEDDDKDDGEYFSPLHHHSGEGKGGGENRRDDLEQIVFV